MRPYDVIKMVVEFPDRREDPLYVWFRAMCLMVVWLNNCSRHREPSNEGLVTLPVAYCVLLRALCGFTDVNSVNSVIVNHSFPRHYSMADSKVSYNLEQ